MPRVSDDLAELLDRRLADADRQLRERRPGESGTRQPVHTVYVPADRFTAEIPSAWGAEALALLDREAPNATALAGVTGLDATLVGEVHDRVRAKLTREPVEDLRVDFEDGYGLRDDDEEDRAVRAASAGLGELARREGAPPFLGIRFKSFEAATRRRGLRTLDLLLDGLLETGDLPAGLRLTLPKVTAVAQVAAMVEVCGRLEVAYGLAAGRLTFEVQVETPQAVLGADGTATLSGMLAVAAGRCTGLHFGTYDYSAALGIAAAQQSLEHPAADHAKAVMQLAAAGTGVQLSDGSTNVLPVGSPEQVHAAWRLHARLVGRALERGFYQGWDLHPGQLPTRYLATYAFFRRDLPATAARIRAYLARVEGGVLDEPATAQALATAVLRGVDCGAVSAEEVAECTGADRPQLETLAYRAGRGGHG